MTHKDSLRDPLGSPDPWNETLSDPLDRHFKRISLTPWIPNPNEINYLAPDPPTPWRTY